MTLNTARKIEMALRVVMYVVAFPLSLVGNIFLCLSKPFKLAIDGLGWIYMNTGNWLMHKSDAVNDGTIQNPYCLRNYTAIMAWNHLQEEKKRNNKAVD